MEKVVDKAFKPLNIKEKEKSTLCEQLVDKYGKTIPVQFVSHFILNRQYRQWEVGVDSVSIPDTLVLKCNQSVYLIPRQLVAEADGFCWDSPQKGKNIYDAKGTFLFVSRKAMQQLRQSGVFIYNGITWRQIAQDASSITVKADVDGTLMQIATRRELPWVLKMENNPLGIDWHLVPNSETHAVK